MKRTGYFFFEALRGLYQAKVMTFVSIVTAAVALFFLGGGLTGFVTLQRWFHQVEERPEIVAFLQEEASLPDLSHTRLSKRIKELPQVRDVVFIGKDEARHRFEQLYGAHMLTAVHTNPLPASLEIRLAPQYREPRQIEAFVGELAAIRGIEATRYSRQWLALLQRFRRWFLWGTFLLIILAGFGLHFMIANTIRLTIYARRELIENMQYVGATRAYIQAPFIIEGMVQGSIGALLALMALLGARLLFTGVPLQWDLVPLPLVLFSTGVVFGWIGSVSALRRFL